MGLMDKLKRATGTEDNYGDYADEYYDEFERDDADESGAAVEDSTMGGMPSGISQMGGGISLSGASLELKVVKPQHFDSVPQIADHLLNKRTVVLNLENTNKETARRLIDFLSGVAYSIDGSLKKIASNAYVITPSNVDVGDAQLRDKRTRPERPERESASAIDNGDIGDF